jgi:hypothetical protein
MWHFEKAAELFGDYKPDIRDALEEFNESIEELRAWLQDGAEGWGFTYTLPPWR